MAEVDKKGSFYLGRNYDWRKQQLEPGTDKSIHYDAGDMTTHAVCVGMTGSGKTGLCLALLEEAALNGIPAIAIDPKGDLGNLLLAFPKLRPEDFRPWIDESEAQRKNVSPDDLATTTAQFWRDGLAKWNEDGSRIQRYLDAVDLTIYTPGSNAGMPMTVLRSFAAPPAAVLNDADALRESLVSTVSGLLSLLGIEADPVRSREHILLSQILEQTWRGGQSLDLPGLIRAIQSPPFSKVGFVDLDSFYPAKDRTALAMQLNNLLASPGFSAWMEGDPLDIQKLFYTAENKPRLSIINIAHLNDTERMFFVTILLGELLSWVRAQPGSSSLRALFYMDEVFGYFPPSRNPPSKTPMLTLLKQARAFGLGIMLATQNPVDLDYKGLSNAGTWFLGRLQTERDKNRVIEGLEGASAAAGSQFDRAKIDQMLSALGNRVFLMNNVHDNQPVVFQTRWCLSYLRGPLSKTDIQRLMGPRKQKAGIRDTVPVTMDGTVSTDDAKPKPVAVQQRPLVPPEAGESFAVPKRPPSASEQIEYRPALIGAARLHFVDTKHAFDQWQNVALVSLLDDKSVESPWTQPDDWDESGVKLEKQPDARASFTDLPAAAGRAKSYAAWQKDLASHLYSDRTFDLCQCEALGESSEPGETKDDFLKRLEPMCREQCKAEKETISDNYSKKLATIDGQIQRANQAVQKQKGQRWQKILAFLSTMIPLLIKVLTNVMSSSQRKNSAATSRRKDNLISEQDDLPETENQPSATQQKLPPEKNALSESFGNVLGGRRKIATQRDISSAATALRRAGSAVSEQGDVKQTEDSLEMWQQRRSDVQAEWDAETAALDKKYDLKQLVLTDFPIHPRKTDIAVSKVALVWLPYRVGTGGQSERAY